MDRKIKANRKGWCDINFGLSSKTRLAANVRVRHKKIGQWGSVNRIIMKYWEYITVNLVLSINVFIPIQRGQTANCCCSKYLKSQLFINRMPKMCAIPQFVLAPLRSYTKKHVEHFRRSRPQREHSHWLSYIVYISSGVVFHISCPVS